MISLNGILELLACVKKIRSSSSATAALIPSTLFHVIRPYWPLNLVYSLDKSFSNYLMWGTGRIIPIVPRTGTIFAPYYHMFDEIPGISISSAVSEHRKEYKGTIQKGFMHFLTRTHTHTHTHIYIYIYVCVCVCVCIYMILWEWKLISYPSQALSVRAVEFTNCISAEG